MVLPFPFWVIISPPEYIRLPLAWHHSSSACRLSWAGKGAPPAFERAWASIIIPLYKCCPICIPALEARRRFDSFFDARKLLNVNDSKTRDFDNSGFMGVTNTKRRLLYNDTLHRCLYGAVFSLPSNETQANRNQKCRNLTCLVDGNQHENIRLLTNLVAPFWP